MYQQDPKKIIPDPQHRSQVGGEERAPTEAETKDNQLAGEEEAGTEPALRRQLEIKKVYYLEYLLLANSTVHCYRNVSRHIKYMYVFSGQVPM